MFFFRSFVSPFNNSAKPQKKVFQAPEDRCPEHPGDKRPVDITLRFKTIQGTQGQDNKGTLMGHAGCVAGRMLLLDVMSMPLK